MADRDTKRYYWLKLEKDFFKRHDIRIIKAMPNGKDYIIFYLTLLCESTSHEGYLRFSETIPYNEEMLSTITDTNIDVVRSAIKVFTELNMMSVLDDGTIYMSQVEKMIGSETGMAQRMRNYRENQKVTIGLQCNLDIEKEKDIDIEIDKKENYLKEKNMVELVEETIKRCLTPQEIEIVRHWDDIKILEKLQDTIARGVKYPIAYTDKMVKNSNQPSGSKWLDKFNEQFKDDKPKDENDKWLEDFKARHSRGA